MSSTVLKHAIDVAEPTPTRDSLPRRLSDFATLVEAVEYAARGMRGLNFHSARGELSTVLTYWELCERAREVGRKLVALGYGRGERVALIAATDPAFVIHFIGCQYASVLPVPLPLPTSFGGRESYVAQLRNQLRSCRPLAVLGPAGMEDLLAEAGTESDLRFCGSFDEFAALTAKDGDLRLPESGDIAYLQYSSGSTRFPHGVAVSHRALLNNCSGQGDFAMKLHEDDRAVSWLPFYHDMGLVGMLLTPLTNQVSADYLATEDFARRPLQWIELLSRNRGTIAYSPTFGYDICARRVGREAVERYDLSAWRVAGIGGDMIRPEVLRRFADAFALAGFDHTAFVPSYGLAECTLAVSIAPLGRGMEVDLVGEAVLKGEREARVAPLPDHGVNGRQLAGKPGLKLEHTSATGARRREVVNCGRILPGYELEVRDEHGDALGDGEVGRIFVRGASVMDGYFGDPETTAAVLSREEWLDTGDMGYMRDGSLFVIGRAKDMIIVNGRNHWPQDIEWAAEQVPGVRPGDAAAVALLGPDDEEVPTVLVQCRVRDLVSRRDFVEQLRRHILSVAGIHCRVELVPPRTLPRTSSGKLSRSRARRQFLAGELPALDL